MDGNRLKRNLVTVSWEPGQRRRIFSSFSSKVINCNEPVRFSDVFLDVKGGYNKTDVLLFNEHRSSERLSQNIKDTRFRYSLSVAGDSL